MSGRSHTCQHFLPSIMFVARIFTFLFLFPVCLVAVAAEVLLDLKQLTINESISLFCLRYSDAFCYLFTYVVIFSVNFCFSLIQRKYCSVGVKRQQINQIYIHIFCFFRSPKVKTFSINLMQYVFLFCLLQITINIYYSYTSAVQILVNFFVYYFFDDVIDYNDLYLNIRLRCINCAKQKTYYLLTIIDMTLLYLSELNVVIKFMCRFMVLNATLNNSSVIS